MIAGALAVLLLALGVPQTLDSYLRLYAGLPDVFGGTANIRPGAEAASTESALKAADHWTGDPSARINAGILERRFAFLGDGRVDVAGLTRARRDITDGLARTPANALAWAELAMAELGLGDSAKAAEAWRTSILLANYEPSLNLWRAQIGLQLWPDLSGDERQLLSEQINFGWVQNSQQLISMAKSDPFMAWMVRDAIAADPQRLSDYDRELAAQP